MEITVNGKMSELKFNFKALFKANKEFGSVDKNGKPAGDGAINLFNRILSNDITVIPDIIRVAGGFNKLSDDDLFEAIDTLTDGGDNVEEVMGELKDEMKNGGFFKQSILSQVKMTEELIPTMEAMAEKDDELKIQLPAVKRMTQLAKENL